MAYLDVAELRDDGNIARRIMACVAVERIPVEPGLWVTEHAWEFASQPGWADAWASAKAGHDGDDAYQPGRDGSVITDAMILSAVQSIEQSAAAARAAAESVA